MRRRCPVCGGRRLTLGLRGERRPLTIAGGSIDAPEPRWRCRSCGMRLRPRRMPAATLWQRRRPLSSWLFGRL